MGKVAKLVYVSLATRVIVNDDASDTEILEQARKAFLWKVNHELGENLEEIIDDEECPFDSEEEKELLTQNGWD